VNNQNMVRIRDSAVTWPIKKFLRRFGLAIHPFSGTLDGQLVKVIEKYKIENFVDIGAHEGEWSRRLKRIDVPMRLFAIEPSSKCCELLQKSGNYEITLNFALGQEIGKGKLYAAGSVFASLREDLKSKRQTFDVVEINTLDNVARRLIRIDWTKTMLKIDVQGGEIDVLKGATKILGDVAVILIECGLNPRYKDGSKLTEVSKFLEKFGFSIAAISTDRFSIDGTEDCDVIFVRSTSR